MMFFKNLFNAFKKDKSSTEQEIIEEVEVKKEEKETKMEEKKNLLSVEQLYQINGNYYKDACNLYIDALNTALPLYSIDTPLRIVHFLAQIIHESGHLKSKTENLNYSAGALRAAFSKYFNNETLAMQYERQPEKIANRIYANRMGNGDEESGDGWKYRGRGLIQITGKNNYKACGEALGLDLVSNPDLIINDPLVNIKSACWYWTVNSLNTLADKDDITAITKRINGGINGLEDRKKNLMLSKKILGLTV